MTHNKIIEDHYDIISKEFDDSRVRIWQNVCKFIKNGYGKSLLDVGVGNGKNSIYASNCGYHCIGIDISNNLIQICKNKGLNAYKVDMLELTPELFGKFDDILCIASLHHLENVSMQINAIINMINCLNENGRILISVWSFEKYDNPENIKYRDFTLGPNIVKWNSKNKDYQIDRFYYIHNLKTFNDMFVEIQKKYDISYEISWEKQNWFVEIKKN